MQSYNDSQKLYIFAEREKQMVVIDKIDYGTETAEILHHKRRHAELH